MRLTAVSRAQGLKLARRLPATGAVPLLQAGAELTEAFCASLREQGIHAVWVEDDLSQGIEPSELLPEHVRQEAAEAVRQALDEAGLAFQRSQPIPDEVIKELTSVSTKIVQSIAGEPDASLALVDLSDAHDDVHLHSVNVCALGLALGHQLFRRNGWIDWDGRRRRDRQEERLVTLGVGLLLHDVGKVAIPAGILGKSHGLTETEQAVLRTHPQAGLELLRSDTISLVVKSIVRDHHERWDGRGFPRGVERDAINPLARIAAVANMYDNVTRARADRPASPPHVGVAAIKNAAGHILDPGIVEVFREFAFPYPVGSEVEVDVAGGVIGVVAQVDPAQPDVPIVRFQGPDGPVEVPIDLSRRAVSLVSVEGYSAATAAA